jgi:enoyl-CoA hydratase
VNEVLYSVDRGIATITLNRPEKLNAIGATMIAELRAALTTAAGDNDVKVLLLAGAGRAFSAGFDINEEMEDETESPLDWLEPLERDISVTMAIWSFPKPTIAVVQGYCLAGGCEMAMACDMIVASEDAQFGEPEIQYGSGPVTLLMPFILGHKKTNELLFTGDRIDSSAALQAGLVNRVVAREALTDTAQDLARRIALTPLAVLRLTKMAISRAFDAMGVREAVKANLPISAILNGADTPEQREFSEIAKKEGLKAALAWRDSRY